MAFEILATCPRSALRALRSGLASRRRRLTLAVALLLLGLLVACAPSISEREAVHVLTYDGTVDPVMVGYIDRGIDSRGVIECLVGAPLEQVSPIFLLGNHEETLLRFLDDFMVGESWLAFGGDATLYSYGVQLAGLSREQRTMIEAQLTLRENMPESHLAFLRGLESHHRIGDYFFAHAGVRPGVPLDKQSTEDLIWIRDVFL